MTFRQALPLLLASAAASFGALYSVTSDAAVRAISGVGCHHTSSSYWACSIPVGTDLATSDLANAYIDYSTSASTYLEVRFEKWSYTGSYYDDFGAYTTSGQVEQNIASVHTKQSPSQWDYLDVQIIGSGGSSISLTGVTVVTN